MKHYATPFDVHADRANRGGDDYLNRAAYFADQAKHKTPTDNVFTLPVLREVSHLHDLEQECYNALGECIRQHQRAKRRAYQHAQRVAVCNEIRTPVVSFSLAQVAAMFTTRAKLFFGESPPGSTATVSPMATCAASNAPGLVRHAHKTQRGVAT